jgi:hypothetical protein
MDFFSASAPVDKTDQGRIKIKWNSSQKNQRRTTSFAFFVFLFLTSFCLLCLIKQEQETFDSISDAEELRSTGSEDKNVIERPSSPLLQQRLPGCIIIGGRKCGTRALLEFIGINSRVVKVKDEVHFFDEDSRYSLGIEWYRSQMPYSSHDQVTIEKTPAYFITETAPDRIRSMNESIKLILIVRDPVVRLISDYAQLNANKKAKGERPLRSFAQMVFTPEGEVDVNFKPVKTSIYAYFYSRWTEVCYGNQTHFARPRKPLLSLDLVINY